MKQVLKNIVLFLVFGAIYFGIECIWKGHLTHWSMFVLAGALGVSIGGLNNWLPWDMPFFLQCILGMLLATAGEGIAGIILNVWLKLQIWDYSTMPLNFFCGQCCVPFCMAWLFLAGVCILIDDLIRWKWFGESVPHYH